jgi:hypothetical protein
VAIAFGCFAAGVIVVMRWRAANRARVFAREEKTPAPQDPSSPEE